jgi:hypothetical protein
VRNIQSFSNNSECRTKVKTIQSSVIGRVAFLLAVMISNAAALHGATLEERIDQINQLP